MSMRHFPVLHPHQHKNHCVSFTPWGNAVLETSVNFFTRVPKTVNHSTRARLSSQKNLTCSYCKKTGHSLRRCVSKFLAETAKETPPKMITRSTALMATSEETPAVKEEEKSPLLPQELEYSFVLSDEKTQSGAVLWILEPQHFALKIDDIVDCKVVVSAAGDLSMFKGLQSSMSSSRRTL